MTASAVAISGKGQGDVNEGVVVAIIAALLALGGQVYTAMTGRTPYAALAERVLKLEALTERLEADLTREKAAARTLAAELATERRENKRLHMWVGRLADTIRSLGGDVPAAPSDRDLEA